MIKAPARSSADAAEPLNFRVGPSGGETAALCSRLCACCWERPLAWRLPWADWVPVRAGEGQGTGTWGPGGGLHPVLHARLAEGEGPGDPGRTTTRPFTLVPSALNTLGGPGPHLNGAG